MVTTVYLVRHGQRADVDPNWKPKQCHHTEVHLSPLGKVQAEALASFLKNVPIDRIYVSPYLRAIQTVEPIAREKRLLVRVERGVMEWQNIEWFPKKPPIFPFSQLSSQFPFIDPFYRSRFFPRWPENKIQVQQRMNRVIHRLVEDQVSSLLIVGHGATVILMAQALLNNPQAKISDVHCSITQLNRNPDNSWVLVATGIVEHLSSSLISK